MVYRSLYMFCTGLWRISYIIAWIGRITERTLDQPQCIETITMERDQWIQLNLYLQ